MLVDSSRHVLHCAVTLLVVVSYLVMWRCIFCWETRYIAITFHWTKRRWSSNGEVGSALFRREPLLSLLVSELAQTSLFFVEHETATLVAGAFGGSMRVFELLRLCKGGNVFIQRWRWYCRTGHDGGEGDYDVGSTKGCNVLSTVW